MHLTIPFILPLIALLPLTATCNLPNVGQLQQAFRSIPQTYNDGPRPGNPSDPCTDVHIILVRGSIETYPGRMFKLVAAICNALPGTMSCDYADILYPATFENYCDSVVGGVEATKLAVRSYAAKCPTSKVVLSGFSQGAQVIGDMLAGVEEEFLPKPGDYPVGDCVEASVSALEPGETKNIAAALLWGSTRHNAGQSYNMGTGADRDGVWPRSSQALENLNRYADILGSWCDIDDPYCAGGNNPTSHVAYFRKHSDDAAEWLRRKILESGFK